MTRSMLSLARRRSHATSAFATALARLMAACDVWPRPSTRSRLESRTPVSVELPTWPRSARTSATDGAATPIRTSASAKTTSLVTATRYAPRSIGGAVTGESPNCVKPAAPRATSSVDSARNTAG
jgi:hypothetical protein